jgi:hypothetical protein
MSLFTAMAELAFLGDLGKPAPAIVQSIIESLIGGQFTYTDPLLTPSQLRQLVVTIKTVAGLEENERPEVLSSLGCPDAADVAALINVFAEYLLPNTPIHTLRDFDWSASVVLGTGTVSNLKEPILTIRFDTDTNENGKTVAKSRNIEFTLEEAQQLLKQLDAARSAQRDVLQK